MYCRSCGTQMPDGSAFCPSCGMRVDGPVGQQWGPGGYQAAEPESPDAWKGKMWIPLFLTLVVSLLISVVVAIIVIVLLFLYYAVFKTPRSDTEVKGALFGGTSGRSPATCSTSSCS